MPEARSYLANLRRGILTAYAVPERVIDELIIAARRFECSNMAQALHCRLDEIESERHLEIRAQAPAPDYVRDVLLSRLIA